MKKYTIALLLKILQLKDRVMGLCFDAKIPNIYYLQDPMLMLKRKKKPIILFYFLFFFMHW